jgi:hypothetical protein
MPPLASSVRAFVKPLISKSLSDPRLTHALHTAVVVYHTYTDLKRPSRPPVEVWRVCYNLALKNESSVIPRRGPVDSTLEADVINTLQWKMPRRTLLTLVEEILQKNRADIPPASRQHKRALRMATHSLLHHHVLTEEELAYLIVNEVMTGLVKELLKA